MIDICYLAQTNFFILIFYVGLHFFRLVIQWVSSHESLFPVTLLHCYGGILWYGISLKTLFHLLFTSYSQNLEFECTRARKKGSRENKYLFMSGPYRHKKFGLMQIIPRVSFLLWHLVKVWVYSRAMLPKCPKAPKFPKPFYALSYTIFSACSVVTPLDFLAIYLPFLHRFTHKNFITKTLKHHPILIHFSHVSISSHCAFISGVICSLLYVLVYFKFG